MTESPVAEIVNFRVAEGVSDEDLRTSARAIGNWLAACPGFAARTLSRDASGDWTDHVLWDSHEAAQAAGRAIMAEPSAQPFMAAIDPASVRMVHAPVALRQTNGAA